MRYNLSSDKGYLRLVDEAKKENDESVAVKKLAEALKNRIIGASGSFKKNAIAGIEQITEKVLDDQKLQKGKKIGYFTELASNLPAIELALTKSKEPWTTDLKGSCVSDSDKKENIKELEEKVKKLKNKVDLEAKNPSFSKVSDAILEVDKKVVAARNAASFLVGFADESVTEINSADSVREKNPNIKDAIKCISRNCSPAIVAERFGDIMINGYKIMLERIKKAATNTNKEKILSKYSTLSRQKQKAEQFAKALGQPVDDKFKFSKISSEDIDKALTSYNDAIKAIENVLKLIPVAVNDYDNKYFPAFKEWRKFSGLLGNEKSSGKVKFAPETFLNNEVANPRLAKQRDIGKFRDVKKKS